MKLRTRSKRLTLRTKINLLVLLIIGIILLLVTSILSFLIINWQYNETGHDALTISRMVSRLPEVVEAFSKPDPSAVLQPLAEKLREQTGAEFIVIGDMNLTRYSHPNPAMLGQTMVGGDDEDVLHGKEGITYAQGTLGPSVRGKVPVFDASGRQIGVVSVGFLVQSIKHRVFVSLLIVGGIGIVGLLLGLLGAHLLSGHVRRQIFNMEPFEIAKMAREQTAILESIREGLLAVDRDGRITACNGETKRLLGLDPAEDIVGRSVQTVVPNSRLMDVMEEGISHTDQPMIMGNTLIIANRVPVRLHDQVIGAVASFRDKLELERIDQGLADVGRYVDALRSQRHEFMNRLHTISGLIQLKQYDQVLELIHDVNEEQQRVLEFFMSRIRDSAVVGILLGKLHRAKELGIRLEIEPASRLRDPCPHREVVVTILGNAIDNAFEALGHQENGQVTVTLNDEGGHMLVKVRDNGPGVAPALGERIFEDGITTKGAGRGLGLALLSKLVAHAGGTLAMISSESGATLEASLPKEKEETR